MTNIDLRAQMKKEGVRQWMVAEFLNYDESVFSRKMRKELSENERQQVLEAIKILSNKGAN
jgi:tagatose-1,6-bisphosphate aldolase